MKIHVNPIASDGNTTIGYDDDGLAGMWAGNMAETCDDHEFAMAKEGLEWSDGKELWDVFVEGELIWRDGAGDEVGAPR